MSADAMEQVQLIGMLVLGLNVVAQVTLLALQLDALRAYGHVSFLRLGIGSGCILGAVMAVAVPMFVTLEPAQYIAAEWVGLALSAVGVAVGLWGTATLFQQYGRLHQAVRSASVRSSP